MLVLSRKRAQSVCIGPDVRITVVKIDRSQVRLGIEAPEHVSVLRTELLALDRVTTVAAPARQRSARRRPH